MSWTKWLVATPLRCSLVVAMSALAFAGDDRQTSAPLRFRRVLIPAARLADWPREPGVEFVPVPAAEFERLLKRAGAGDVAQPPAARVAKAEYDLRLLGPDELAGTALFDIQSDWAAELLLEFDPGNLAIHQARWEEDDQPAIWGLDNSGRKQLLVKASGALRVDFTLRARPSSGELGTFDLILPRSPINRLDWNLPGDREISCTRGRLQPPAEDQLGEFRTWKLDLGGQSRLTARLTVAATAAAQRPRATARQTATYDLSERGVEVAVRLELDIRQEPLSRLRVSLDPGLKLLATRHATRDASFHALADQVDGREVYQIEFAEPLLGSSQVVQLSAVGSLKTEAAWSLPTVRAEGVDWQEGSMVLIVPASLEVQSLSTSGCRQSKTSSLPSQQPGESLELQCFQADARVEVFLSAKREQVFAETGAAVQLGAGETTGILVAGIRAAAGSRFTLDAHVAPQWTIDSVVSDAPGLVADWEMELHEFPRRTLHIQLSAALSPANPIRLMISGRRLRSPLGETLSLADLRIADFRGANVTERLFMLSAESSYDIELNGAEGLARLDPDKLEAGLTELFVVRPSGLLFRDDSHADGLQISLERKSPKFSAEVRLEASVVAGDLRESYFIRCPAAVAHNDRLLVTFSQSRPTAPRWSVTGGQTVEASRLEPSPFGGAQAETWEVSLPSTAEGDVELRAVRGFPLADSAVLSLAAIPEASAQVGRVYVRGESSAEVEVSGDQVEPFPIPAAAPSSTLAAYRYDPSIDASSPHAATLRVGRVNPRQAAPTALVWQARTQSYLQPGSVVSHCSLLRVENHGQPFLEVTFPADAIVRQVEIDNQPLTLRLDTEGRLQVALPSDRRFVLVCVHFSSPQHGTSLFTAIDRPEIKVNAPLLDSSWTVFAPPTYQWLPGRETRAAAGDRFGWSRRLLGWLARSPGSDRFNPFEADAWRKLVQPGDQLRNQQQVVRSCLTQLGDLRETISPTTWQQRLVALDADLVKQGWSLLIDHAACAESGVLRDQAFTLPAGRSPLELGTVLLARHKLGLLLHDQTVILTSQTEAALWGQSVPNFAGSADLATDAFSSAATGNNRRDISADYCQPAGWPALESPPWIASRGILDGSDFTGWTGQRFRGAAALQVRAIHRAFLGWLHWGALIVVVAFGWRRAAGDLPAWWVAVGVLAVAALLLPPGWFELATGAFWGGLVCLARGIYVAGRMAPQIPLDSSTNAKRLPLAVVAGALLSVLFAGDFVAAVSAEQAAGPPTKVHSVLIPQASSDAENPSDNDRPSFYRVPQEFLTELKQAAAIASHRPQGWLLCRGDYRATWNWDATHRHVRFDDLKASLRFHVFSPGIIRIPLGDGAVAHTESALLDGVQTPLDWAEDGKSVAFHAPDPGECQLDLVLQPAAKSSGNIALAVLDLPAIPQAVLEVFSPRDAAPPSIDGAWGQQVVSQEDNRTAIWLGPAEQLNLEWADQPESPTAAATWDVEELLWLQIQPGSVVAEARFKINVTSGSLRQLTLLVDPRWRLLPPIVGESLQAAVRGSSAAGQLIDVAWDRPETEQVVVPLRLFLADSSGFGRLRPPRIELPGARGVKRFLAVSVDPKSMKWRERGELGQVLAIPDFLARWGEREQQPQVAYQVSDGDIDLSLETEPIPARVSIRDTLALGIARGRIDVVYQAEVWQLAGSIFQYQLQVPSDLEIQSLLVREPAGAVSARWSRDAAGAVTVLLKDPASANQSVELLGFCPAPADGDYALPRLAIDGAESTLSRVQIFRHPAVLIDIGASDSWTVLADPAVEPRGPGFGRLVGVYESQASGHSLGVTIRPNAPLVARRQVTLLEREERGTWVAECRFEMDVEGGVVDDLRFKIPPAWSGPFQFDPPVSHQLLNVPGEDYRQLVLRPRVAIADKYQLTVRGPWQIAAGSRPRAPVVWPLGSGDSMQILVLPKQLALQPVDWDVRGMQPADLPLGLPARFVPESFTAYRVTADAPDAVLRQSEPEEGDPVVVLGDIRLTVDPEGEYSGVALFDLAPSGKSYCPLHLPESCKLLACRVAGVKVGPMTVGSGRWQVPLASNRLAQRLEVMFAGRTAKEPGSRPATLGLPQIAPWKTLQTIVTLAQPSGSKLAPSLAAIMQTPDQLDLARVQSSLSLLDASFKLMENEIPTELTGWRDLWLDSCHRDWTSLQSNLAGRTDPSRRRVTESDVRKVEAGLVRLAGQFHAEWPPVVTSSSAGEGLRASWRGAGGPGNVTTYVADAGALPQLTVIGLSASVWEGWLARLSLSFVILVGTVGMARLFRRHLAAAAASPVWILAAGLGWWMWLTASIGGPILVLAVLLNSILRRALGSRPALGQMTVGRPLEGLKP